MSDVQFLPVAHILTSIIIRRLKLNVIVVVVASFSSASSVVVPVSSSSRRRLVISAVSSSRSSSCTIHYYTQLIQSFIRTAVSISPLTNFIVHREV